MTKKIKVKLVRSLCGAIKKHRGTIKGLGLRKVGSEKELSDTPEVRGMIKSVTHLVQVDE